MKNTITKLCGIICIIILVAFFAGCSNSADEVEETSVTDESYLADEDYSDSLAQEDTMGLTEEDAALQEGLFIKSGDSYYPVPPSTRVDHEGSIMITPDSLNNNYALKDGCELVFFSDTNVPEIVFAYPVKKEGYTIDAAFLNKGLYFVQPATDLAEYYDNNPLSFPEDIDTVDGMDYKEFVANKCINPKEYCTGSGICDWSVADLEHEQVVELGYHEGTEYMTESISADSTYYMIDGCNEENAKHLELVLGTEPYGTINAGDLSPGKYILKPDAFDLVSYILVVE